MDAGMYIQPYRTVIGTNCGISNNLSHIRHQHNGIRDQIGILPHVQNMIWDRIRTALISQRTGINQVNNGLEIFCAGCTYSNISG